MVQLHRLTGLPIELPLRRRLTLRDLAIRYFSFTFPDKCHRDSSFFPHFSHFSEPSLSSWLPATRETIRAETVMISVSIFQVSLQNPLNSFLVWPRAQFHVNMLGISMRNSFRAFFGHCACTKATKILVQYSPLRHFAI